MRISIRRCDLINETFAHFSEENKRTNSAVKQFAIVATALDGDSDLIVNHLCLRC